MSDTNPFNITREELLELAAQKLADQFTDEDNLSESVNKRINERIEKVFATGLNQRIDAFLMAEMDKLVRTEICPVDIWGDKAGKPTTIRDSLAIKAHNFWNELVDDKGNPTTSSWGSKKRHEWLFQKIVGEEFASVVKQNLVNLIVAFKDAVREDAKANIDKHLSELIRVKGYSESK